MTKKISRLQYIATTAMQVEQACKAGANWIQLRLKNTPHDSFKTVALEAKDVCARYNAVLIINDNVALAAEINADGVHLGKEDMPPAEARNIIGNDKIIGCSTNTLADIEKAVKEPIDYLGLGPYRFTTTRDKLNPILGLKGYQQIFKQIKDVGLIIPPIVGIGGVMLEDVVPLLQAGLYGIAVSGAISNAKNIELATAEFIAKIKLGL